MNIHKIRTSSKKKKKSSVIKTEFEVKNSLYTAEKDTQTKLQFKP